MVDATQQFPNITHFSHFAPSSLREGSDLIKLTARSSHPTAFTVTEDLAPMLERSGYLDTGYRTPQMFNGKLENKVVLINDATARGIDDGTLFGSLTSSQLADLKESGLMSLAGGLDVSPIYGKNFVTDISSQIRNRIIGNSVNLPQIKKSLIEEMDTPDYMRRLKANGFTDDEAANIIADKKKAIENTKVVFDNDLTGSGYSDGVAYIASKGKTRDQIIEDIQHEIGHSDTTVPEVEYANNKNVPAFRKEYMNDNPTDGRKPKWEYYGEGTEAAQRAKAVIRYAKKEYPDKTLDEVYDIIQAKINNGERLPEDVYSYVHSYNEPKTAKAFLNKAIGISPLFFGTSTILRRKWDRTKN